MRSASLVRLFGVLALVFVLNASLLATVVVAGAVTSLKTEIVDENHVPISSPLYVGSKVQDTTHLTPQWYANEYPTGTVTYQFFHTIDCTGSHTDEVVTLNLASAPDSKLTDALLAGGYSYLAVYSGDSHFEGSRSSCEAFTVEPLIAVLTHSYEGQRGEGSADTFGFWTCYPCDVYHVNGTSSTPEYAIVRYVLSATWYMWPEQHRLLYDGPDPKFCQGSGWVCPYDVTFSHDATFPIEVDLTVYDSAGNHAGTSWIVGAPGIGSIPLTGGIFIVKGATDGDTTIPFTFVASSNPSFELKGREYTSFTQLPPGEYEFTEDVPSGWVLTAVRCITRGSSTFEYISDGVRITYATPEDMVACFFINSPSAVGGVVVPANTFALVAPWLAVIGLVGCIGIIVEVARKRYPSS